MVICHIIPNIILPLIYFLVYNELELKFRIVVLAPQTDSNFYFRSIDYFSMNPQIPSILIKKSESFMRIFCYLKYSLKRKS